MPNPTQSDLHVNVPLTNVSVAYIQDNSKFIATKMFPIVNVKKQSDLYWKYRKSEWRRTDVQRRAPSTETPGVGWNVTTDQYFCHVYGVHKDIDDQLRANADSNFKLDAEATKFVTGQLLLKRDKDFVSTYMTTGVWDTDKQGVAAAPTGDQFLQWNDAASDPINDITQSLDDVEESTGFRPNKGAMGPRVLQTLRNHPDIIDRIKYTQRGILTTDLLSTFFEVENLMVARASENTGDEYQDPANTDSNASYNFLVGKTMLLTYAPSGPSLMTPSAGYVFTWNGYLGGNSDGIRMKRFRQERIASDRIEGEMTYDMKTVASDCGVYFYDAIA